jgi:preprotein translocase subunit SecD
VLDEEVISAPVIQDHIPGGSGIITGRFTVEESTSSPCSCGRARCRPNSPSSRSGRSAPNSGRIRSRRAASPRSWPGRRSRLHDHVLRALRVFASIALVLNVFLIFGALSAIGATLTLPGIAGIVLTIGMAVDANVLVFERIREELKTAKGPARAIELGYEKALSAILDANITTFIIAAILFTLGSGPVRGFAITLGIGILTSVFTAVFVTRLIVVLWFERRRPRTIEV